MDKSKTRCPNHLLKLDLIGFIRATAAFRMPAFPVRCSLFLRFAGFDLFVDVDRRRRGSWPAASLLSTLYLEKCYW